MRVASPASIAYSEGPIAVNDNRPSGPADGGSGQVLFLLGELSASVKAIHDDLVEVKASAQIDREEARTSRHRIHERLDDAIGRLVKAESTIRVMGKVVDRADKRVNEMEPVVRATAKVLAVRGSIIVAAATAIGGGAWYVLSTNWVAIWRFLDQFIPRG
jgi:hypothetical protein